jgi:hypothetical protein
MKFDQRRGLVLAVEFDYEDSPLFIESKISFARIGNAEIYFSPLGGFSSCRPSGFHQLGKPLPSSSGDSAFFSGRGPPTRFAACFLLCPTSSGGR